MGWDDLPSDSEDTFFLTPREVADYHRDKRLRMMEKGRQDRLRALAEEDGDAAENEPPEAQWGGSDEEVRNSAFPYYITRRLNCIPSFNSLTKLRPI